MGCTEEETSTQSQGPLSEGPTSNSPPLARTETEVETPLNAASSRNHTRHDRSVVSRDVPRPDSRPTGLEGTSLARPPL